MGSKRVYPRTKTQTYRKDGNIQANHRGLTHTPKQNNKGDIKI